MSSDSPLVADAFLLFGATGDLARKKLFPALYQMATEGRLDMPVVGIARRDWSDEQLRTRARESIADQVKKPDPDVVDALCAQLRYLGVGG